MEALESNWERINLKIPMSNIKRSNTLILHLKNLRRKNKIELHNVEKAENSRELVRYKYSISLSDINLSIKVLIKLGD